MAVCLNCRETDPLGEFCPPTMGGAHNLMTLDEFLAQGETLIDFQWFADHPRTALDALRYAVEHNCFEATGMVVVERWAVDELIALLELLT